MSYSNYFINYLFYSGRILKYLISSSFIGFNDVKLSLWDVHVQLLVEPFVEPACVFEYAKRLQKLSFIQFIHIYKEITYILFWNCPNHIFLLKNCQYLQFCYCVESMDWVLAELIIDSIDFSCILLSSRLQFLLKKIKTSIAVQLNV